MTDFFGSPITRKIWGSMENLTLAFVGSAADFALNPENFWLFFTNSLPSNPQKRFIETFKYTQQVFFMPEEQVPALMSRIRNVHSNVEKNRERETGDHTKISNNAFRQVGDMLIDYGIKGYEYLYRKNMSEEDKDSYFQDMKKLYGLMGVTDYETNYNEFLKRRNFSVQNELKVNEFTEKLYGSYKKDLGLLRVWVLKQLQCRFIAPVLVKELGIKKNHFFTPAYILYPYIRNKYLFDFAKFLFLKKETIKVLDQVDEVVRKHESMLV